MNKNTEEWIMIAALILTIICAFIAAEQRNNLKQEAVNRGFAEWKVVGENKTEFVWREKQ
jgi:hypothetical protein